MFIKKKLIHGRTYYYAARTGRVDGHVRVVEQIYLGRLENLVALQQSARPPAPERVRTRRYGAVAALWQLARELDVPAIVNEEIGAATKTANQDLPPSAGEHITLAAIHRAVAPASNQGLAGWYAQTSLTRLCPAPLRRLSSQRFWAAVDQLDEPVCQRIFRRVARQARQLTGVRETVCCYNLPNFLTFSPSDSGRPQPNRQHDAVRHHDLQEVGLALAVGSQTQLPLFYWAYGGDRPDMAIFKEIWPQLQEQVMALRLDTATLVCDKGSAFHEAQAAVDAASAHYVASAAPGDFPELLAIPLESLKPITSGQAKGLRAHRIRMKVLGRERTVVMTYSPVLAAIEERDVRQHLAEAEAGLTALQQRLTRNRQQPQGRKPAGPSVRDQIDQLLQARHLPRLLSVEIVEDDQGFLSLAVSRHDDAFKDLGQHLFGRRIWVTDQDAWTTEQIVAAAQVQATVEAAFALLHDGCGVAGQPMWHWTDQNIQVHVLYCVLALLLVRLLQWRLRDIDRREAHALLHDLDEIQECAVVYPPRAGAGRPRLVTVLNELTTCQQALVDALHLALPEGIGPTA